MTEPATIVFTACLNESVWTETLRGLPTSNCYTSWAWGEYKKRMGWSVERIVAGDSSGAEAACFQLQRKKLGPFSILLVQGGIHLRNLSDERYHEILDAWLASGAVQSRLSMVLINHQAGGGGDVDLGLLRSNFTPVLSTQMYTFVIDAAGDALEGKAMSRNWRHNLKRAVNNPRLATRWIEDPAERARALGMLEEFYGRLRDRKSFGAAVNFQVARDLIVNTPDFRMIEATLDGEVIAVRVGFFASDHVLDFLAASHETARNTYANYLLLWKLIEAARESGKKFFDCGGINPADETNIGVYNFKKGLGGRVAVNGPIWVNSPSAPVKKLARLLQSLTL